MPSAFRRAHSIALSSSRRACSTAPSRAWHRLALGAILLGVFGLGSTARAQPLVVTIENLLEEGGFSLTPFWVALQSGDFDVWRGGEPADAFPGLEALAEEGNTQPISDAFSASQAGENGGVQTTVAAAATPPPVFSPGESVAHLIEAGDPAVNRYFSYASMVVPSNDLFVASSVGTTHEVFDADGVFQGPVTIEIFGRDVVDCGTEVNDITGGAAFTSEAGEPADEMNPLARLYMADPDAEYLQSIVGVETATGAAISSAFGSDDLLARITVDVSQPFRRGDVNADARVDISDGISILVWLFYGGQAPGCLEAADADADGAHGLSDATFLLGYLFSGTSAPPSPGPQTCGQPDELAFGCARQTGCDEPSP